MLLSANPAPGDCLSHHEEKYAKMPLLKHTNSEAAKEKQEVSQINLDAKYTVA